MDFTPHIKQSQFFCSTNSKIIHLKLLMMPFCKHRTGGLAALKAEPAGEHADEDEDQVNKECSLDVVFADS